MHPLHATTFQRETIRDTQRDLPRDFVHQPRQV